MEIKTNKELVQAVQAVIAESGIKKSHIAEQLNISKQAFSNFLNKSNFSIDDANKILKLVGYEVSVLVNKKS